MERERMRRDQGSVCGGRSGICKVMPWVFEQYSVRYDQLAELLGRWPGKETQQAGRLGDDDGAHAGAAVGEGRGGGVIGRCSCGSRRGAG